MRPKNHETKVRFGEEDYKKLQKKAEKLGLKISQYIRMVSLNFTIDNMDKLREKK